MIRDKMKKFTNWFLLGMLLAPAAVAAPDPVNAETYARRRAAVMEKMGGQGMLILFSALPRRFTGDTLYRFRQENNLYYLTGVRQEDTVLVLMPANRTRRENLFILSRDPSLEVWTGARLSAEQAREVSGISNVYDRSEFDAFVESMLSGRSYSVNRYTSADEFAEFFSQLKGGTAALFLLLEERPGLHGPLNREFELARTVRERFPGISVHDSSDMFAGLRLVKRPEELDRIRRAIEITEQGLSNALGRLRPGVREHELQAVIENQFLKDGAASGFPSIIGSGPNATTLHYNENSRQVADGELIVIDVGAEFDYYSADITRTVPANGKFSPAQADIYRLVLQAQEAGMTMLLPGKTISDVHRRVVETLRTGLLRLGLITDAEGDQYRAFFMHWTSHWLGMDVHDVGDLAAPFQPGMVLTVEPGIYVRENLSDILGRDPANRDWIEKMRPAFEKYRGIGVRIEDDVLITEGGYEHLSRRLPRRPEEVEATIRSTRAAADGR